MRTLIPAHRQSQDREPASLAHPNQARFMPVRGEHPLLRLQRTIGNQATLRMLRAQAHSAGTPAAESARLGEELNPMPIHPPIAPAIQTKLTVNEPGDEHEQEADRMADHVMRMAAPVFAPPMPLSAPVALQPKCACGGTCDTCQANRKEDDHEQDKLRRSPADSSHLGQATAPPIVEEVLRSPGQPLDRETQDFMEPQFGTDFGAVRIHTDSKAALSAESVKAKAYAVQNHIAFGADEYSPSSDSGKTLLAHELTHVVQQSGARAIVHPEPTGVNAPILNSSPRIARQPAATPRVAASIGRKQDVLESGSTDHPRRTKVVIFITGHASPRWRGAHSSAQADKLNMELSHKRETVVRERVENLLRGYLPDQQLVFDAGQTRTVEDEDTGDTAHIDIASSAAGSRETLHEAGKAGRNANDPSMLRVDVNCSLSNLTDTETHSKIRETHLEPTRTKDWAIKIGVGEQADFAAGVGGFNFMLKDRKTGREIEGWAHFSVAAPIAAGLPIPTISQSGYADFSTNVPVDFAAFHAKNFTIHTDLGVNLLLVGGESSEMTILGLPGGNVSGIDVGGFAMGGAGITIESYKFGAMYLREVPGETLYPVQTIHVEDKESVSESKDVSHQTVLFKTEEFKISPDQEKALDDYVSRLVRGYEKGEP